LLQQQLCSFRLGNAELSTLRSAFPSAQRAYHSLLGLFELTQHCRIRHMPLPCSSRFGHLWWSWYLLFFHYCSWWKSSRYLFIWLL